MKLYANVSSERASKGQGGNDFINIELFTGSKNNSNPFAEVKLTYDKNDGIGAYRLEVIDKTGESCFSMRRDEACTDGWPHRYDEEGNCTGDECYDSIPGSKKEKTKGKRQKGEKLAEIGSQLENDILNRN